MSCDVWCSRGQGQWRSQQDKYIEFKIKKKVVQQRSEMRLIHILGT